MQAPARLQALHSMVASVRAQPAVTQMVVGRSLWKACKSRRSCPADRLIVPAVASHSDRPSRLYLDESDANMFLRCEHLVALLESHIGITLYLPVRMLQATTAFEQAMQASDSYL